MTDSGSDANHWRCPSCGTRNANGTRLCYACGTADPNHEEPKSDGWIKTVAWFGISVAVGLIALLILWGAVGEDVLDFLG
jgi:hypothetical protein